MDPACFRSKVAFDAPSREECTAERPRSNTPLQALVLLNDPTYVEAARSFAERIVRSSDDKDARFRFAMSTALSRQPSPEELEVLTKLQSTQQQRYEGDVEAAEQFLGVGMRSIPEDIPAAELASYAAIARALLNLHETITRQ